ncbi:MAG TPA: hypothetical protein VFO29_03580 [Candidatus Rubrimentiphilum sp.]|nr:hypothetical protein [Candidatus Rubrimentiphilum sp.]
MRAILLIVAAFFVVVFIAQRFVAPAPSVTALDYKTFYQKLETYQVQTFHARGLDADGTLTNGTLYTTGLANRDPAFAKDVVQHVKGTVTFESSTSLSFLGIVFTALPFVIVAFLILVILRTAQRGQFPRP